MAITTAAEAATIVNTSLKALGYDYQIDKTDGSTIEAGFKAIGAYSPDQKNALLGQINTILVFRNYGTMFTASDNPTRKFWREDTKFGGGIEDIYHELITPVEASANGDYWAEDFAGLTTSDANTLASQIARDLVKFYQSNVDKKFHTSTGHFTIPLSLTDLEVSKLFTPEGMASYIDVKMANMQWSAEVKLQDIAIAVVKSMVDNGDLVFNTDNDLSTQTGIANMVEAIQTVTDGMCNLATVFNKDGINTISKSDDLYFFTTPEVMNRLRVQGYANAYNLKEYAIKNNIVLLPYGTDLGEYDGNDVLGVLLDKRAIVMSLRYWAMRTFLPANTDYNNYFLKVQYIKGYNTFFNAVAFVAKAEE